MKKWPLLFLLPALIWADYDLKNVSGWDIHPASGRYNVDWSADFVGDSKFTKDSVRGDHIRYGTWEAEVEAVAYSNPCQGEGANIALSYDEDYLDWECNPFFDRRTFNTGSLSLLFYTQRIPHWSWVAQATYRINANNWGFLEHTSYDWLVWGRLAFREAIGLHVGLFAQTGLHLPLILPIAGFDWQIADDLKLSLVFPVNLSLDYTIDSCYTLSLRGRWWSSRYRVGEHEHFSKAVWRYTNFGLEGATLYNWNCWLYADFHAGCTFGGRVKVAHRRGRSDHTLHFRPAAYFGGEIVANF